MYILQSLDEQQWQYQLGLIMKQAWRNKQKHSSFNTPLVKNDKHSFQIQMHHLNKYAPFLVLSAWICLLEMKKQKWKKKKKGENNLQGLRDDM